MSTLVQDEGSILRDDVRTALEAVRTHRGKRIFRMRGRTVSTLAHVEQAALLEGMTPEEYALVEASLDSPEASASAELPSSAENKPQNETTVPLLPGVAVLCAPGASVPFSEGARWIASADFKCFLELGEEEHTGLYRELLVGPFRPFDLDNDHELPPGNFLTDPEWDFVVGEPRGLVLQLIAEIGFDPNADRPDESKPRGETWLAERSNWENEVADIKRHIAELEGKLAQPVAIDTPSRAALPANALEMIQAAGKIGKEKAQAILDALQSTEEPVMEPSEGSDLHPSSNPEEE